MISKKEQLEMGQPLYGLSRRPEPKVCQCEMKNDTPCPIHPTIPTIPKYPDALRISGRLFRLGLADHDYGVNPEYVALNREGIERLLDLAEKGFNNEVEKRMRIEHPEWFEGYEAPLA